MECIYEIQLRPSMGKSLRFFTYLGKQMETLVDQKLSQTHSSSMNHHSSSSSSVFVHEFTESNPCKLLSQIQSGVAKQALFMIEESNFYKSSCLRKDVKYRVKAEALVGGATSPLKSK